MTSIREIHRIHKARDELYAMNTREIDELREKNMMLKNEVTMLRNKRKFELLEENLVLEREIAVLRKSTTQHDDANERRIRDYNWLITNNNERGTKRKKTGDCSREYDMGYITQYPICDTQEVVTLANRTLESHTG